MGRKCPFLETVGNLRGSSVSPSADGEHPWMVPRGCASNHGRLGWHLGALTVVNVRKLPCSPCFMIWPLLCQVTSKTANVFQPLKMIEGLAHRLYSYKMRSSHQDFLWFRRVQWTFLPQSSPFPPPPVLWLLWCFLAPAEIKSRRAGYCKNGYFSRTHCACRKQDGKKMGLFGFVNVSQSFSQLEIKTRNVLEQVILILDCCLGKVPKCNRVVLLADELVLDGGTLT